MASYTRTTWGCGKCGYSQDFDPTVAGEQVRHFPEFPGIPDGACPACYSGTNRERIARTCQLDKVSDLSSPTTVTVAPDTELESRQVLKLDANDQLIMEQTGSHYELQVDQSNGKISSVGVPVMAPRMCDLTDQELAALKQQRDQNLDALDNVAVK